MKPPESSSGFREADGNAFHYEKRSGFSDQFDWHLLKGTRPDGTSATPGKPWKNAEFGRKLFDREHAGDVGRSVGNWRRGTHPEPGSLTRILDTFFGKVPLRDPGYKPWRDWLRALWEQNDRRRREPRAISPDATPARDAPPASSENNDGVLQSGSPWIIADARTPPVGLVKLTIHPPPVPNEPDTLHLQVSTSFGHYSDVVLHYEVIFRLTTARIVLDSQYWQVRDTPFAEAGFHHTITYAGGVWELVPDNDGACSTCSAMSLSGAKITCLADTRARPLTAQPGYKRAPHSGSREGAPGTIRLVSFVPPIARPTSRTFAWITSDFAAPWPLTEQRPDHSALDAKPSCQPAAVARAVPAARTDLRSSFLICVHPRFLLSYRHPPGKEEWNRR
ncbi:MAG: hypothetical protein ABSE20_27525 [Acetobacteraceae bacterium]